jgi:hypothetical protein
MEAEGRGVDVVAAVEKPSSASKCADGDHFVLAARLRAVAWGAVVVLAEALAGDPCRPAVRPCDDASDD